MQRERKAARCPGLTVFNAGLCTINGHAVQPDYVVQHNDYMVCVGCPLSPSAQCKDMLLMRPSPCVAATRCTAMSRP